MEQRVDEGGFVAVDVLEDYGEYDVRSQLGRTQFANLGECLVAAWCCGGVCVGSVVGWCVRDVVDGGMDVYEMVCVVERTGVMGWVGGRTI